MNQRSLSLHRPGARLQDIMVPLSRSCWFIPHVFLLNPLIVSNSLHVGYCFLSLFQITLHGISWTKSKCYETPMLFNKISMLMISLCLSGLPQQSPFILRLYLRFVPQTSKHHHMFVNKCKCCNHHIFEIVFSI